MPSRMVRLQLVDPTMSREAQDIAQELSCVVFTATVEKEIPV